MNTNTLSAALTSNLQRMQAMVEGWEKELELEMIRMDLQKMLSTKDIVVACMMFYPALYSIIW